MLLNLLANACDAIEGTGTITVETEADRDFCRIRIRDTGQGIPPEVAPRIFNPFFTTKEPGAGTGLGLSISYNIVTKDHRGTLTFTSEVGRGSEFVVAIPLRLQELLGVSAEAPPPSPGGEPLS